MSFASYDRRKDSGFAWLGEIPSHWEVIQSRRLFTERKERAQPGDEQLTASQKHGILTQKEFGLREGQKVMQVITGMDILKHVEPNDFVISMRSFQGGLEHSSAIGCISSAYVMIIPTIECLPSFYKYLFKSPPYIRALQSTSNLVRDGQALRYENFTQISLPLPPKEEQDAIAAFLDRETAKIDALVEEQQRLIELIKEKRQAVISQAVTKGLNPNATMKDSGIEWLGEVPANWEIKRLKYLGEAITGLTYSPDDVSDGSGCLVLRSSNIQNGAARFDDNVFVTCQIPQKLRVIPDDILICSRNGSRSLIGKNLLLNEEHTGMTWGAFMTVFRSSSARFLYWVFNSLLFSYQAASYLTSTVNQLTIGDLNAMEVPVPSPAEAFEIDVYLSKKTAEADKLLEAAFSATELLLERRAALISAAVTGKIDVRGSAELLTFPVDRSRARGLIAAEIIERSAHQATFGRVKLQKISYLAEAHVGVSELGGIYLREAAGPLDREMVRDMEREAGRVAGIRADQPAGAGAAVHYRLGGQRGTHRTELAELLGGERSAKLDKLIDDIATIDTKGAEAVATLYAVWNDALMDGETPTDTENVLAVLTEWHPEKKEKFRMDELHTWLGWMRRHGLVPRGSGPKTSTGRLFT